MPFNEKRDKGERIEWGKIISLKIEISYTKYKYSWDILY